ncbi:hypothetical protein V2J09_003597 [Rumex salicifolius]
MPSLDTPRQSLVGVLTPPKPCRADDRTQPCPATSVLPSSDRVSFPSLVLRLYPATKLLQNCKHTNGDVVLAPSVGDAAIMGIPKLDVLVRGIGIDGVGSSFDACSQMPLAGDNPVGFDIFFLNVFFSKKLRIVKSIPPKLRLSFARVFCSALDLVLARPGDGHFTVAIKVLTSSGIAPLCHDILRELEAKHPYAPSSILPSSMLVEDALSVRNDLVLSRIHSFPKGTSCGCDGLRAHILGAAASADFQFVVGIPEGGEAILHFVNRIVESKGNTFILKMLSTMLIGVSCFRRRGSSALLLLLGLSYALLSQQGFITMTPSFGLVKELNKAWYLDDGTIVGDTLMVAKAFDIKLRVQLVVCS